MPVNGNPSNDVPDQRRLVPGEFWECSLVCSCRETLFTQRSFAPKCPPGIIWDDGYKPLVEDHLIFGHVVRCSPIRVGKIVYHVVVRCSCGEIVGKGQSTIGAFHAAYLSGRDAVKAKMHARKGHDLVLETREVME